ncbi:MAG: hypothetical protein NZM04_08645, partial [Methylacidiphilales bacterium]|nr:hypothetical protein [Candidatus Methylacidiphilales bacterium]
TLIIICLGILAYGYIFHTKNTTSDLPQIIGYNLPFALLFWAIFYSVVGQKQGIKKSFMSFMAIYGSFIASDLISQQQKEKEASIMLAEILKSYNVLISSVTNGSREQYIDISAFDTIPKAKGVYGEVEHFTKTLLIKIAKFRNEYQKEVDDINIDTLLDPTRLRQDKDLRESKLLIHKAKDVVDKYRALSYKLLEDSRLDIISLKISDDQKKIMLRGYDRTLIESRKIMDVIWGLEYNIILEAEKIIDLLSKKKGAWLIKNNEIIFKHDNDMTAFNNHLIAIQIMAHKQEEIRKDGMLKIYKNLLPPLSDAVSN